VTPVTAFNRAIRAPQATRSCRLIESGSLALPHSKRFALPIRWSVLVVRSCKRDMTDPEARFLDDHDRSAFEEAEDLGQEQRQPIDDMLRARVSEPKDDCADVPTTGKRNDLAEVEIERHDDAVFRSRFLEDLSVGKAMELLVAKVLCVMTGVRQPLRDSYVGAHVDKESRHQTL
jgi:hypothetical protein